MSHQSLCLFRNPLRTHMRCLPQPERCCPPVTVTLIHPHPQSGGAQMTELQHLPSTPQIAMCIKLSAKQTTLHSDHNFWHDCNIFGIPHNNLTLTQFVHHMTAVALCQCNSFYIVAQFVCSNVEHITLYYIIIHCTLYIIGAQMWLASVHLHKFCL